MRHPAVDAFFVCRIWAFSKGRLFTCRQLFLTPYNIIIENLYISCELSFAGVFLYPHPINCVRQPPLYSSSYHCVLSLTTDACRTHKPGAEEKCGNSCPIILFRSAVYPGVLIRFCLSTVWSRYSICLILRITHENIIIYTHISLF